MSGQPEEHFGAGGSGWPLSGRQTVALLVVLVAGTFILQNTDEVAVQFFTVTIEAPLWLVLTALFVVGALVGMLLGRRHRKA